jgi:hypothetical protein
VFFDLNQSFILRDMEVECAPDSSETEYLLGSGVNIASIAIVAIAAIRC